MSFHTLNQQLVAGIGAQSDHITFRDFLNLFWVNEPQLSSIFSKWVVGCEWCSSTLPDCDRSIVCGIKDYSRVEELYLCVCRGFYMNGYTEGSQISCHHRGQSKQCPRAKHTSLIKPLTPAYKIKQVSSQNLQCCKDNL